MGVHSRFVVAILLMGGSLTPLSAQSLGDVARREAERRKTIQSEGRTYTNKDLPNVPPATAPASATPGQAPPAADPSSADPDGAPTSDASAGAAVPAEPVRDQKYWSDRLNALQETLTRNGIYVEALQSQINALTTDFVNRDDPAQRELIARDRQTAIDSLNRLKTEIANTEKAIAALHEEARQASVPPGWLR